MKITVSGKEKEYSEGITIKQLIEAENVENPLYVTVTLNDAFIQSSEIETAVIKDGDNIEFLYFMGGGC